MARPAVDAWVIEKDEFHPDLQVAATYADHAADLYAKRHLAEQIDRLRIIGTKRTRAENTTLAAFKLLLTDTEQRIKEFIEKEAEDA